MVVRIFGYAFLAQCPAQQIDDRSGLDGLALFVITGQHQLETVLLAQPQQVQHLHGADAADFVQHHDAVVAEPDPAVMGGGQERIEGTDAEVVDAGAAQLLGLPPGLRGAPVFQPARLPRINQRRQHARRLARPGHAKHNRQPAFRAGRLDGRTLLVAVPAAIGKPRAFHGRRNLGRCQGMPAIGDSFPRQGDEFGFLVAVQFSRQLDLARFNLFPDQPGFLPVLHDAAMRPMPGHQADVVGAFQPAGGNESPGDGKPDFALTEHGFLGQHVRQEFQPEPIRVREAFSARPDRQRVRLQ